jgi:hypothetical protein
LTSGGGQALAGLTTGKEKFCQPDFLLLWPEKVLVVEAKLTRCADGLKQLLRLYKPLVELLFPGREVVLCQAFSNWAGGEAESITTLDSLLQARGPYIDLHWKPDHDTSV